MTDWTALLDALEARTARVAQALHDAEPVELPDVVLHADGPLPPPLRLRAAALLAQTDALCEALAARRAALSREQAYAGH